MVNNANTIWKGGGEMIIPNLLTSLSGEPVASADDWRKYRRDEIKLLFENCVYGAVPADPETLQVRVKGRKRVQGILQKKVELFFANCKIDAEVFLSADNTRKMPAFLLCMHQFQEQCCDLDQELDFEILPIPEIVKRGYAAVVMKTSGICPDVFTGKPFEEGIFQAMPCPRRGNSGAVIAAWAWGLSRVLDYLQTDVNIDETRVAVLGHSRSGKTALWAGACDERFAMVVLNNSGCTGAAVTRGKKGEHIRDINGAFDWFCENYKKYNDNEAMLPVDQHMLLALIAPRPLYIASSSEDEWADPDSELLSCRLASAAYGLYGMDGAVVPEYVERDVSYNNGRIAYHRKTGIHSLTKFDWNFFMDFADRFL